MGPDPQRNISFLRLMLGLVVLGVWAVQTFVLA